MYHVFLYRLEIFVDDEKVGEGRLQRNFDTIEVRENGGLFLGGVPESLSVENQAATSHALDGCLSDVVINGK